MCELIEPYHGIVYDGACGSGGMFVQSMRFVDAHGGNRLGVSIYGQELTVDFYHRLRDEKKFPSVEALKEEILKNQAQAEAYFREMNVL